MFYSNSLGLENCRNCPQFPFLSYTGYASRRLPDHLQDTVCRGPKLPDLLDGLGDVTKTICSTVISGSTAWQYDRLENLIATSTRRTNLFFFSIYTTELLGQRYQAIGILGHFIEVP